MFDTMTMTKVLGAVCGSLLVFLLGGWAASALYSTGGGHGDDHAQAYVIDTGASEAPAETAEAPDFEAIFAAADAGAGESVFAKCRACHKLDGADGVGPHLNGIVDKAKAASAGYAYSDTLLGMAGETWTPENLYAFLQNPRGYAPGTKMAFAGLPRSDERANLIAYLATVN
ncbi:c-type cytochrome [Pseudotabrizicola alkalilacus]|uniref:Cytochrome c family protein n=1 Tax=Pseudotabrizicola alkalilacus TaxID=2305252 RepID=A0A411Z5A6_9RHOB|nr:c-type cytochrome [Pseudotabrizicola alkalilacus]RGP38202.1 cytochrome c family protein [Pseudotabrizicola alkalilacus]